MCMPPACQTSREPLSSVIAGRRLSTTSETAATLDSPLQRYHESEIHALSSAKVSQARVKFSANSDLTARPSVAIRDDSSAETASMKFHHSWEWGILIQWVSPG